MTVKEAPKLPEPLENDDGVELQDNVEQGKG